MEREPQLLLINADLVFCETVSDYLRFHGFGVAVKHDAATGLQHATEGAYDLVILDVTLPELNGIEVLRRIRRHGERPVVMLASSSDPVDRILCLELGADDYLPRSCNLRELLARLHSILRRTRHLASLQKAPSRDTMELSLDPTAHAATWRGKPLQLTPTEFRLLEALSDKPGQLVGKAELEVTALGRKCALHDRSLDMHISNLRKKLGKLADGRSPIQAVNGAGYQLLRKSGTD